MVKAFRILHNLIVSALIFSLSLSLYASANSLTLGISGQIKDRCEINFFSGNIMNFTEHRDVQSLPFNIYCNRPLGITINSKYGGLKYQHTALVAAIQAAMINIMPATVSEHRQDEEVNAVYSPRPHQQRSSRNQWPKRRSPCLRCGGKSCFDKTHCPGFNSQCSFCGNVGHLTQVCHLRLLENATQFQKST